MVASKDHPCLVSVGRMAHSHRAPCTKTSCASLQSHTWCSAATWSTSMQTKQWDACAHLYDEKSGTGGGLMAFFLWSPCASLRGTSTIWCTLIWTMQRKLPAQTKMNYTQYMRTSFPKCRLTAHVKYRLYNGTSNTNTIDNLVYNLCVRHVDVCVYKKC